MRATITPARRPDPEASLDATASGILPVLPAHGKKDCVIQPPAPAPVGPVAQWSEQGTHNLSVPGSSPGGPSITSPRVDVGADDVVAAAPPS